MLCYMAGLIVTTVLILWEGWIPFTGSESPVMSSRKWKLKTSLCLSNDLDALHIFWLEAHERQHCVQFPIF
jgi:hypothetical protein